MLPILAGKAAQLLAPVAARFASPWIKWGAIAGGVLLLLAVTNWKTYDRMRTLCEDEKVEAARLAAAAAMAEANRQLTETAELNTRIAAERDRTAAELKDALENVRKKARKYADRQIAVPSDLLAIHDQSVRVSSDASAKLPSSDSRSPGAEVQRGEILPETKPVVRVKTGDGEFVEMTLEDAVNMLADVYDSRARLQADYEQFTQWNEGREGIELGRQQ